MTITNRQPAGQPTGGQFATTARAETGVQLTGAPGDEHRDLTLRVEDLADRAFPPLEGAGEGYALGRVEAQREARQLLPHLSDDAFFNHHWFGIESAAMQAQRFEADEDGEEADGASPADTLDVDLRDFMGINEADRAGESDYVGYDFPAYAAAIAEAWRTELKTRVRKAVEANAAAASSTPAVDAA